MRSTLYTFVNHSYIYYLNPVTSFGHLSYHQGYLFNPTRRFLRLLHSVKYNNCSFRIVSLNMAGKAEICTWKKALNVSVIHKCVSCWLHHSLKSKYVVKLYYKINLNISCELKRRDVMSVASQCSRSAGFNWINWF